MSEMTAPIRILHLEDDPIDLELIHMVMKSAGFDFEAVTVDSREAFEAALDSESFDLVLADYAIPGYDGLSALALWMMFLTKIDTARTVW